MGLAERRAVQTVKDGDYKTFESNLKDICGYNVKVTFDWDKLEANKECAFIVDNKKYNSLMFKYVEDAMKNVCADDMGKSAVQEKLKEIKLVPETGDLKFNDGVLVVSNDLTGNGAWQTEQIQKTVESAL